MACEHSLSSSFFRYLNRNSEARMSVFTISLVRANSGKANVSIRTGKSTFLLLDTGTFWTKTLQEAWAVV
jgi:hypothetical protein